MNVDEALFLSRVERFESAWQLLMRALRDGGMYVQELPIRMADGKLEQIANYWRTAAGPRVLVPGVGVRRSRSATPKLVKVQIRLQEAPSGLWITTFRFGKRTQNFKFDPTSGAYIVGMQIATT